MVVSEDRSRGGLGLSVVIASFNSALWLPSTLDSLALALERADWDAEVIIIDDGSTDGTVEVLANIQPAFPTALRIISQPNKGRFLARWAGAQAALHENLLILDSRMIVEKNALKYLEEQLRAVEPYAVWNGHVETDLTAPLIGHFWSVPTFLFWSDYLSNPRPTTLGTHNFDRLPKGTSFLFLPTRLFIDACLAAWPIENAHLVSDDTKVLRFVADSTSIRIDPGFAAIYRPRTSIKQFLSHSRGRGTLFVDSYAGTGTVRNAVLIMLAVAPALLALVVVALALTSQWVSLAIIVGAGLMSLALPAVLAGIRGCRAIPIISYLSFVLPFGVAFWSGLVRGLIVHRHAFARSNEQKVEDTL